LTSARMALCLAVVSVTTTAQDHPRNIPDSLEFHCFDLPFVGIYARTRNRDTVPAVQLQLTDPLGRTAGKNPGSGKIPDSTYGEVVQLPGRSLQSKALALEVCNASEGIYKITIGRHYSNGFTHLSPANRAKSRSAE